MIIHGKFVYEKTNAKPTKISNALYVKDGIIAKIGNYKDLIDRYPDEEIIGDSQQLVFPGFIDSHSHGGGLSYVQRGETYDYLENALSMIECAIGIDPALNSLLNAVKHIKNGCTTVHHNNWVRPFNPNEIECDNKIIKAYQSTGVRLAFSVGIRNKNILAYDDRNFLKTLPKYLQQDVEHLVNIDEKSSIEEYFVTFEELYRNFNDNDTKIFFGPSWVQGSTLDLLLRIKERADELGKLPIHIHTLQTPIQKAFGIRVHKKSLVEYLDDIGLLDSNLVLGHGVFLNQQDIELLANKKASITHHPSCNLLMRNGIAPIYSLVRSGVNVAMGIDDKGINDNNDPIMEMRMIFLLHRVSGFDLINTPAFSADDVIKICTENGSSVSGFGHTIGKIEVGRKADIILIDSAEILGDPWVNPNANIANLFVHRAIGHHVNTVIIGGELVMKDRKILTIDVDELYKEVSNSVNSQKSIENQKKEKIFNEIEPYYQKWYNDWLNELELEPFYVMNSKI